MSIPAVLGEIDRPENIHNTSTQNIQNTLNTLSGDEIQKIQEIIQNTLKNIGDAKKPQRKKTELSEEQAIEKFDARYVQLFLGSNYVIWDKKEKCPKDLRGLKDYYNNLVVQKTEAKYGRTQTTEVSAVQLWFEQSANRYERCEFLPGRSVIPEGIYNLWDGWRHSPKPGSCQLFLDHVFQNICDRDQGLFDFLMDWTADIFQHPDRKNGVQITLYSREQGTGKSFFWETISQLLEGYSITLSSADGLVGGFNAHLGNKLLVVLEEAFWAGDKKAENVVKTLTTSGKQTITHKGKDTVEVNSFVRLAYSSNESWSNHVGETDRRNFIVEVKPYHLNDRPYFEAIQNELNGGGYEALMDWLLSREIEADWSKIPPTPAKLRNLLRSLSPLKQWVYHNLCQDEGGKKSIFQEENENGISTISLFQRYSEFYKASGSIRPNYHNFSIEFKSLGYHSAHVQAPDNSPIRGYHLPSLDSARLRFNQTIGMEIDWNKIDLDKSDEEDELSEYEQSLLDGLNKGESDEA